MNLIQSFPFSVDEDITVTSASGVDGTWIVPAIMLEAKRNYLMHLYDDGTGYIEPFCDRGPLIRRFKEIKHGSI